MKDNELLFLRTQVVKLLKLFFDMITLDIFFIDWERPKAFNTSDHFLHGSNKSHPGTPSISSSLKPTLSSSPSPTNDCVSAWRNYFVANEWQELITKRKISVQLHVIFVVAVLMVCDHALIRDQPINFSNSR
jgi:meckelin